MGQLGSNGLNVNGTGQNVGDLKKIGYSDSDINGMGTSQNPLQKITQRGTQGLAQGFQNYQNQNSQMRQGGGGMQMGPMPQAQPVDPNYFQPQRRGPNNLSFYGDANG
jgi:hypothetical protein